MADLALVPPRQRIIDHPPQTIVNTLADGSSLRRRKTTSFWREWIVEYEGIDSTDADTIRDLWRTKGLDTTLTIVTYDPREAGGTEATVYFADLVEHDHEGVTYSFTLRFEEAI